jgi:hypothetical protein
MKKIFIAVLILLSGISFMGISSAIAGGECPTGSGTGTPGYWKNHPDAWDGITLVLWCGKDRDRAVPFEKSGVLQILDSPVQNDKWRTLFKAWAAAVLNVEVNNNCAPVCDYAGSGDINLTSVNDWLCDNMDERPVKANDDEWQYSHGEAQYECLDDYNNGYLRSIAISRDELE